MLEALKCSYDKIIKYLDVTEKDNHQFLLNNIMVTGMVTSFMVHRCSYRRCKQAFARIYSPSPANYTQLYVGEVRIVIT